MTKSVVSRESRGAAISFLPEVSEAALRAVVEGDVLAIVVPSYFNTRDANLLARRLSEYQGWSSYEGETGAGSILRIGHALFDCLGAMSCDAYFSASMESRRALRGIFSPLANPADRVVRDVDAIWTAGCLDLVVGGRKAYVGLVRGFENGGSALPHVDRADWDHPSTETRRLRAQLAFNVYLSLSETGGELELWGHQPTRREQESLREDYGFDRSRLPEPVVRYRPDAGDLVIFNAWRIHAVAPSHGDGRRITVSGFLGFETDARPLKAFS